MSMGLTTNRGEPMDLNYIRKLVKLLSESDVDEIEIEEEGKKIRVAKHQNARQSSPFWPALLPPSYPYQQSGLAPEAFSGLPVAPPASVPAPAREPVPAPAVEAAPPKQFHEIKSPIVGTFYRAPAPDAAPFVQLGTVVESGTVLCIVEAMKLMNEIESDIAGRIARILVENGQPVEYDQPLFLVETL